MKNVSYLSKSVVSNYFRKNYKQLSHKYVSRFLRTYIGEQFNLETSQGCAGL